MGFFTGFISGFALTTSALYITVTIHRTNRLEQRRVIRDQVEQINWLARSTGAYDRRNLPEDIPRTLEDRFPPREGPITIKEVLKHRWNTEVEKLARKAHETRWEDVRDATAEGWRGVMSLVKKE
ncbi:hypothetical protein N7509_014257 [Penicillium cosmopolitanum]|uniref:MICOS complex subunit MIC12 n=1 Tax=Penicillium cosmopolitanum TaxID=1131564 RepID=A0A9W9S1L4_9EURO|nr:uncharacterized protein N7509_014257 [Penicillium cosmopolitanum]KAJ5369645.1 hypothetical protein N7509_014257 [Penicillium cosmopolitanum]